MGPNAHRKHSEKERVEEVPAEMVRAVHVKFTCVDKRQSNPLRLSVYRRFRTIESQGGRRGA